MIFTIIDFHTHIFPDKIAESVISKLSSYTPRAVAHTNGTLSGLIASMNAANVDYSVIMPVLTAPHQFESVNRFAAEHNRGNIIYFGGIHPDCEDLEAKVDAIADLGLKGIKLHPDYQSIFVDDDRYITIVRRALARGLLVTFHAGVDIGMPDPVHCAPERSAKLLDAVADLNTGEPKIIFAHLGGCDMPDEVMKHLCGKNCLFDTGFNIVYESEENIMNIIRAHGADKILFASDSPWQSQAECVSRINSLPLTDEEKSMILGGNARKLLRIL